MPVIYEHRDGNEYKIIPAPFCTVSKEYIRKSSSTSMNNSSDKANGPVIGSTFRVTLTGTLTSHKGSPLVGVSGAQDRTFHNSGGYPADSDTSSGGDGDGTWDFGSAPVSGSSTESDNEHFKSILQKQLALRELFAKDGGKLTISTPTYKPFVCYPRVLGIDFADSGIGDFGWNRTVDYTIELEVDRITGLPGPDGKIDEDWDRKDFSVTVGSTTYDRIYLEDVSEDWALEFNEQASKPSDDADDSTIGDLWTFRVSHNLSATGKATYEGGADPVREAWENAKLWVQSRLKGPDGYGETSSYKPTESPALGLDSYTAYDHVRSENADELNGTYSVTESWLLSKNPYLEDFTVSTRYDTESGETTVSIEGSVTGLETRDASNMDDDYDIDDTSHITATKYKNAKTRFDELTATEDLIIRQRLSNMLETTLTALELQSKSNTRNKASGTINYSYEFRDKKEDCEVFKACSSAVQDKIKKSNVQITFTNAADGFAAITVWGRGGSSASNYNGTGTPTGPVLQDMGTTSLSKIACAIEVTMDCDTSSIGVATGDTKAVVDCVTQWILDNVKPNSQTYVVFVEADSESWNPITGRYSRNVTFAYGTCP